MSKKDYATVDEFWAAVAAKARLAAPLGLEADGFDLSAIDPESLVKFLKRLGHSGRTV